MAKYPSDPVLIVDDEEHILTGFSAELKYNGIKNIITCSNPEKVMEILEKENPGMIFLDLIMPKISGQQLLEMIKQSHPDIPVVVVTASSDTETAVSCMKKGAHDFLSKPVESGRLTSVCRHTLEYREMRKEIDHLTLHLLDKEPNRPPAFKNIITQNPEMQSIFKYVDSIASTSQPLFITGETGTGKDLIAKAVHDLSKKKGAFVKINTAGLDDNMFSDTLFGHVKGAYTGADNPRSGLVEKAAHGTLFLDEIGDLSLTSQVKLLGLIQDREYMRIGEDKTRYSDTRIVAATNLTNKELRDKDKFRKDLYFRLMTHHVHLPALKKRDDDIKLLFHHFIKKAALETGIKVPYCDEKILKMVIKYKFPGNVRELEAMVFDAVSTSKNNTLSIDLFKRHMKSAAFDDESSDDESSDYGRGGDGICAGNGSGGGGWNGTGSSDWNSAGSGYNGNTGSPHSDFSQHSENKTPFSDFRTLPTLKIASELLIKEAINRTQGNQSEAARILGISRQALNKRLK
ncbi:MAG: sigma-54 dependent transcriptional regulator [Thermodesulfobacteriota bacterium]|nr:sigma-54 dependent transcriptional regulator [Thermodesulfobacteriota bacterium]